MELNVRVRDDTEEIEGRGGGQLRGTKVIHLYISHRDKYQISSAEEDTHLSPLNTEKIFNIDQEKVITTIMVEDTLQMGRASELDWAKFGFS